MQAFFCGPFLRVFLWIFGRPGQRSKMRWQFFSDTGEPVRHETPRQPLIPLFSILSQHC